MSCIGASVGLGQNLQNDGAVLPDQEDPVVPVVFAEGEAMCLSQRKSLRHQVFSNKYLADLENSLAAAHEGLYRCAHR